MNANSGTIITTNDPDSSSEEEYFPLEPPIKTDAEIKQSKIDTTDINQIFVNEIQENIFSFIFDMANRFLNEYIIINSDTCSRAIKNSTFMQKYATLRFGNIAKLIPIDLQASIVAASLVAQNSLPGDSLLTDKQKIEKQKIISEKIEKNKLLDNEI